MSELRDSIGDSLRGGACHLRGGAIPGLADAAAFRGSAPDPAPIPVVLAAPHGGRRYPPDVLAALRVPEPVLMRLEDRLVDSLVDAVVRETGAPFLIAEAPRAMIDLNRSADDVDWDMLSDAPRPAVHRAGSAGAGHSAHRARSGLGLVPRRLPGVGELWKGRLPHAELVARIAQIHQPYHDTLAAIVERVREQWGAVLLIDLHSMPPLLGHGGAAPQFVIGDRFGTACDGELVASIFSHLAAARRPVAHNRPYAGGFGLDRHARRGNGVHAVQIEIDRTCYLDAALTAPGAGFDSVVELLVGMVRRLAADAATLGRDRLRWRAAAE
jgi:N-formylglutamate amidohydrolase